MHYTEQKRVEENNPLNVEKKILKFSPLVIPLKFLN